MARRGVGRVALFKDDVSARRNGRHVMNNAISAALVVDSSEQRLSHLEHAESNLLHTPSGSRLLVVVALGGGGQLWWHVFFHIHTFVLKTRVHHCYSSARFTCE